MRWHDRAIILGAKPHGERNVIVEVMSAMHGRHLGVVKGGRSRRYGAQLQPGNRVTAEWSARLDEHLGSFRLEVLDYSCARLMGEAAALYAFQLAAAHLRLLPERDPHARLYDILGLLIEDHQSILIVAELLVRFELVLLEELGFGLDLSHCVVTGSREELIYVSPKSACAVSSRAGELWKDKLIALPEFVLTSDKRPQTVGAALAGFSLTGYFLNRHVWQPRARVYPQVRDSFLKVFSNNA